MRVEQEAYYTAPSGEEYSIIAFVEFCRDRDGEDADGNRGWDCISVMDSGYEVEPEPVYTQDQGIIDHIGEVIVEAMVEDGPQVRSDL